MTDLARRGEPAPPVAIGVDVGGTKLLGGSVAADGTVLARRRERTPAQDAGELVDVLTGLVDGLDGAELPVGIGIAGIVSEDGTYRSGPNLDFRDVPVAARLTASSGRTVRVVNDVTAAVVGEQRVGAARDLDDVVMLTLGTGVGGGIVVDGRVVTGVDGAAGELGHMIVREGGRPCPCGNRGCLEAYASGRALAVVAYEWLQAGRGARSVLRDGPEITGRDVTSAALDGDGFAREILVEMGFWLGVGAATVVNALDPQAVVVGGGAAIEPARWILPAARASLAERLIGRAVRQPPPVMLAELGDDAGVIGAALLAADVGA